MSADPESWCRADSDGVVLNLRVIPRSSKSGPLEIIAGQLKWGVHAAAHGGKANEELIDSVAALLRVAKSSVVIRRGKRSRGKIIFVEGICLEFARQLSYGLA